MTNTKRLTATLLAAVTCSLLTTAASAADRIRWLNDWLPAGDKAAIYLGVHEGLFEKRDLEVEIATARGSSEVVTKLGTGSADIGTAGLPALLQAKAESDVPATAIMSIYTKQPDAIFTTASSGIDTLADVAGKSIATATFSSSNVTWPLILRDNGVDPDAVRLLKVDPGALAPMLAAGRVDGTINWITVAPGFRGPLREAGKTLRIIPWSEYGYQGYGLSLVASDTFIEQRPEVLRRFVAGYREALEMAMADPEKAARALKAMVPEVTVADAAEKFQASVPLMDNEISEQHGFGAFDPALLAATWEWVARAQKLPEDSFDPETAVNRTFIPE